jgi:enoyl-CoA hydratase/carnithine racemase
MAGLSVATPRPGVALVVMDRPGRLNALDDGMLRAMPGVLQGLADDPDIRSVVLTGASEAFSAGGDLSVIESLSLVPRAELVPLLRHCFEASALLHAMDKPTIAAVNGPAAGGGLGLALACDIRIASPEAAFVCTFVCGGVIPDYGCTWLLPQVAGYSLGLEMALTGRRVRAEEALAAGLVSRICDDPLAEAVALAGRIAAQPATASALAKRAMREARGRDLPAALDNEADLQADILLGEEFTALWAAWQSEIRGVANGRV